MPGHHLPTEGVLASIALVLQQKRAMLKRRLRIGVALLEGDRFVIDSDGPEPVAAGWCDEVDLTIMTTSATLSDLALGRFDPSAPREGHLFLFSGADDALSSLQLILRAGRSLLALRAAR